MDTSTGELYSEKEMIDLRKILGEAELKKFKQVEFATEEQINKKKVGRNELCPCGSGKKFKKCCLILCN